MKQLAALLAVVMLALLGAGCSCPSAAQHGRSLHGSREFVLSGEPGAPGVRFVGWTLGSSAADESRQPPDGGHRCSLPEAPEPGCRPGIVLVWFGKETQGEVLPY